MQRKTASPTRRRRAVVAREGGAARGATDPGDLADELGRGQRVRKARYAVLARSGLPELTFHDLRHSHTTIAAAHLVVLPRDIAGARSCRPGHLQEGIDAVAPRVILVGHDLVDSITDDGRE